MRYTQIIDITECPALWRNHATARVYLFMTLKAGYHDDDRGLVRLSVRQIAAGTGLTKSAVEHALAMLTKWKVARRYRGALYVATMVPERPITKPKSRKNQEREKAIAEERERRDQEERQRIIDEKENGVSYREHEMLQQGHTMAEIRELRQKNGGNRL